MISQKNGRPLTLLSGANDYARRITLCNVPHAVDGTGYALRITGRGHHAVPDAAELVRSTGHKKRAAPEGAARWITLLCPMQDRTPEQTRQALPRDRLSRLALPRRDPWPRPCEACQFLP